jgi:succinyl-diaminopimelate desuccinylase
LKDTVLKILAEHGLQAEKDFELSWRLSGEPFLTATGNLLSAVQEAIREVAGVQTELSTSGGTSDGRFIAPTGAEVIELGPLNDTIHKINECVRVADLEPLCRIYEQILVRLLAV